MKRTSKERARRLIGRQAGRIWKALGRMDRKDGLSLFPENRRRLRDLRNRHAGRRVFVIGNGPSLAGTDLTRLKNEITIGCNGLFLIFDQMGFLPTYYTVEDTLVAEERAAQINAIHGPVKIFPFDVRPFLKPDPRTAYVNFIRNYTDFPRFSRRLTENAYWGGTVTYLNLQLAFYLGARDVFLLGLDHYYHSPTETDRIRGTVIESSAPDRNHMHPDYFGPGFRYHDPRVDRMEIGYRKAAVVYAAAGRNIYNATAGGCLEVFQRVDFKDLF